VARSVSTAPQLARLLSESLDVDFVEVDFSEDIDGDLVITLQGVTFEDGSSKFVANEREFEVEAEVTVPVRFTVKANSEEAASDLAEQILSDAAEHFEVERFTHSALEEGIHTAWASDWQIDSVDEA